MSRNPDKIRCTAHTQTGNPCRNWALPDAEYCRSHLPDNPPNPAGPNTANQNARKHGLYARYISAADAAALLTVANHTGLGDEIALTRVIILRLAEHLASSDIAIDIETAIHLADAMFRGTGRVAALLKAQHAISGDAADGIAGAIAQALDELNILWENVEL